MKNLLVLVLALLLIPLGRTVVAAPAPETAPGPTEKLTRLHFKGDIRSTETYVMISPIMSVTAAGSGNATQLGQFTVHYELDVNVLDLSETGSVYFAGTNGDSIHAEGIGQAVPNVTPDLFNIVEIYTITGGTGRFTGASGTFTLNRLISISSGAASGTLEGYILLPWK